MSCLRVAVLCDYAEERWPSMDLAASMLLNRLSSASIDAHRVQPPWKKRFERWLQFGSGRNADRLCNRLWDFPRWTKTLQSFDVYHVIDHSYAHLVHSLPTNRTVVTCHDTETFRCLFEPETEPRPAWFRLMARHVLRGLQKAAGVICVSEATRARLIELGIRRPEHLFVAHNGVQPVFRFEPDAYWDNEAARLLGPPSTVPELLHVGSTVPRKRIDRLLNVFAACRRNVPSLRLLRVGAPLTATQSELGGSLGVNNEICNLGFVDNRLLAALYRRAALTLVTSDAEGFGLPLAESMACGTHVVASDLTSLREVGGAAATYCMTTDLENWAGKVLSLLSERAGQPERWASRVLLARERAGQFCWDRNALTVSNVYRAIARREFRAC